MPTWWKRQTATVDAFVAGGVTLAFVWWFGQLLQLWGTIALYAAVFGAFQLMRFVGAQLAELQWVRLHEAVLREKRPPAAPPPAVDGYRQAAVIEEASDPEDDRLETEVRRRGRRATISLAVTGAVVWAASVVVAGLVLPTLVAGVVAGCAFALRGWRRHEARQHRERETKAMIEAGPRVRIGVDFGVPATELQDAEEANDTNDEITSAKDRAAR